MKPSPENRDRQPVPGRDWWITRRAVDLLVALGISPNLASTLGMMFGLAAGGCFALTRTHPGPQFWLLGALFVFLRSAFNVLDGMIAHRTGLKSRCAWWKTEQASCCGAFCTLWVGRPFISGIFP